MADPLSIAASAVAVAGAGFKLADIIHSFVDNVRKAERHLRPIAQHVDLTSSILDTIGELLGREKIQRLCHVRLLVSIKSSMKGCRDAFRELEDYLNGLIKAKRDGSMGLTAWNKAFWSYRQKEIDVLQAHLERFKSSLDLVLNVLTLISTTKGRKISDQEKGKKSELNKLIKAKDLATAKDVHVPSDPVAKSESSQTDLSSTAVGPTSPQPAIVTTTREDLPGIREDGSPSLQGPEVPLFDLASRIENTLASPKVRTSDQAAPGKSKDVDVGEPLAGAAQAEAKDDLLQHLSKCAEAVAVLSSTIENATKLWQASRQYERYCIAPAYKAAQTSLKRLRDFEEGLELTSKKRRLATELQDNPTATGTVSPDEKKDSVISVGSSDPQKPGSLTSKEQSALQKFNRHASSCRRCRDVYKLLQRRKALCTKGEELAKNVTEQLQYIGKGGFSTVQADAVDNTVPMRLGAEHEYAIDLLKARFRFPVFQKGPEETPLAFAPPSQEPMRRQSNGPEPTSRSDPSRRGFRRSSTSVEHFRKASDYPVEDIIDLSVPLGTVKKGRKKANKAHRGSAAVLLDGPLNYANVPFDLPTSHLLPQEIYPQKPFAAQEMQAPPHAPMPRWQQPEPPSPQMIDSYGKQPGSARDLINPNPFQPQHHVPPMFDQPQEYPHPQQRSRNRSCSRSRTQDSHSRARRHLPDRRSDDPHGRVFDEQDDNTANNSGKLWSGAGGRSPSSPEALPDDLESSAYGERRGNSLASDRDVNNYDDAEAIEKVNEEDALKMLKEADAARQPVKKCKEFADEEEDFSAVDRLLREWTLLEV